MRAATAGRNGMRRLGGGGAAWLLAIALLPAVTGACGAADRARFREGDIIFQPSRSAQSRAIQLATGSRYSHMGLILEREGRPVVFEAAGRVGFAPLDEWILRGEGRHYVVKRLKRADRLLTPSALGRLAAAARELEGRPYDLYFGWEDDRVYCSELVWKVYERALGLRIGEPAPLSSFDLSAGEVRAKLRERYGDRPPLDEPMISPAAMFESPLLRTVE
jgi:hypothetical protein